MLQATGRRPWGTGRMPPLHVPLLGGILRRERPEPLHGPENGLSADPKFSGHLRLAHAAPVMLGQCLERYLTVEALDGEVVSAESGRQGLGANAQKAAQSPQRPAILVHPVEIWDVEVKFVCSHELTAWNGDFCAGNRWDPGRRRTVWRRRHHGRRGTHQNGMGVRVEGGYKACVKSLQIFSLANMGRAVSYLQRRQWAAVLS